MKTLLTVVMATLLLSSCAEECKTCYGIEAVNGVIITETEVGDFCGDEIEEKENQQLICIEGNCYFECR